VYERATIEDNTLQLRALRTSKRAVRQCTRLRMKQWKKLVLETLRAGPQNWPELMDHPDAHEFVAPQPRMAVRRQFVPPPDRTRITVHLAT